MAQNKASTNKTLGRPSGSLNAPIAAFTMAVILFGYCISSIRTARRDAQDKTLIGSNSQQRATQADKDSSWVQQALQESQAERNGKSSR
ncbi:hypothetical protein N7478_006849 [Penicillium angulare]|uniref:uncharacterized protein n=1 Tax=Penicillium angulare TaxID=116970 RepID=UPI002540F65C|nr:uncharacterized protein N7478_006849 [Penicillium angulare]KAJ5281477.1 hypothetical protein N7478_006849 [Penicillium angulare]